MTQLRRKDDIEPLFGAYESHCKRLYCELTDIDTYLAHIVSPLVDWCEDSQRTRVIVDSNLMFDQM